LRSTFIGGVSYREQPYAFFLVVLPYRGLIQKLAPFDNSHLKVHSDENMLSLVHSFFEQIMDIAKSRFINR
jgi:hypothetical protein